MPHKVIERFKDLQQNKHVYEVGDEYPAEGFKKPTKVRITELSGKNNKAGKPLIVEVEEEQEAGKEVDEVKKIAKK